MTGLKPEREEYVNAWAGILIYDTETEPYVTSEARVFNLEDTYQFSRDELRDLRALAQKRLNK